MSSKTYCILFAFCTLSLFSAGQQPTQTDAKYGKIAVADFNINLNSLDSNADAVVIADVGSSQILGNSKGWFSLEFTRFRRVKILNKSGYDAANVEIYLYKDGTDEEQLNKVKAVTYNMENGKVSETRLDSRSGVYKDVLNSHEIVRKFTFPNVREGSIIEYEYTVTSDFLFNLQPWGFQREYPVLWSEYNLTCPEFLGYVFLTQGYQPFYLQDKKYRNARFHVADNYTSNRSESLDFDAQVADYRWVMRNVPALKEESFTSTINNHIAKISFQLSEYKYPLQTTKVMGTWPEVCDKLLKSDQFGADLNRNNGWMSDVVKPLINGVSSETEKAKNIFNYVRDNFTCTSYNRWNLDESLKNIFKKKKGSVAEINLLLTAMLKYADINADPVILSTRSHGYTYALYPVLDRFNYVICMVKADRKKIFLDASQPRLGFGRLTPDCYNGNARVVDMKATPLEFSADSLLEKKSTYVFITQNDKGEIVGKFTQTPGYYESHTIRERIKEKGKDDFFQTIRKAYGPGISELFNSKIDQLDSLETSVKIFYEFKMNQDSNDIIYVNPMMGEGYKQNPFKSAERFYPVEMPYVIDESYNFSLIIPGGYQIDELPKSEKVVIDEEGDGQFEYLIAESGGVISIRARILIKRTFFQQDEYEILREFFNRIVKKQSEQIVLKKKS
ncbi:MAG: hypothetical protein B6D37_04045 [Sphingobacteriales bacterium UTBCD1]|jgi:hypothetical protein|nr:MAG: hypothetical protein B6D37_04045 [Sphingobacteriales bacterium UTBCD1]